MKKLMLLALVFMIPLVCFSEIVYAKSGPIPIRNQMPLYLFYLQMEPDETEVVEQDKFSMDADYTVSNITVSSFTPGTSLYNINIDAEVSRITLDFRYGIYENTEIGLEVPYLILSKGYLDSFVEDFEDVVRARTPRSRIRQGSNNYNYSFIYDSQNLINKKTSSDGLGDIVLKAKYSVINEEDSNFMPSLSIRSAVKFPTARKSDLLGSGEFDFGLGVVAEKSFFKRVCLYCGMNVVFIQKPSFFSVLNLKKEILSGMAGLEYFITERFSLLTQVIANSTPYPSSGTNVLDESVIDIGFGLNYNWKEKKNVSWRFAVIENYNSASSPDVSFNTGWKIGF